MAYRRAVRLRLVRQWCLSLPKSEARTYKGGAYKETCSAYFRITTANNMRSVKYSLVPIYRGGALKEAG